MSLHKSFEPQLTQSGFRFEALEHPSVDRILSTVRKHLGTEIAFVSRYVENEEKELTHVSSDLELPMGPGFRDPRENSYCWHILEGRLPELIQDPADHPFAQTIPITDFLPVGCHLNTPLRLSDGTVYGSFCCLSRQPDRSMTERDLQIVRSFAELAAAQIERTLESDERHGLLTRRIGKLLEGRHVDIVQQPIVSLKDARPVGLECLARFPDARRRGPDRWFAEAEEVGLGSELEVLAIANAIESAAALPEGTYISVNVSPQTALTSDLWDALAPIEPGRIVLEITEHEQVADFVALKEALGRLRPRMRIAIDDVGSGYAGLRHLVDLAPDLLKLDISLTRDVHRDIARRALITAMVHFAGEIGAKLVAEGIECREEHETLAELGVDFGQGYYFAKPMPPAEALAFVRGRV